MKRGNVCGLAGLGLSVGLLVIGPSAPACAQPPPPEPTVQLSGEANKQWESAYDEGRKAAKAGQWAKARDLFMQAWGIKRHHRVGGALGRAEVQLGKFRDAAEHLAWALTEGSASLEPDERKAYQEVFDKARAKVGVLSVTVDPPGAEVLVNGRSVGTAPLVGPVFVDPGPVIVEARLEGYAAARESRIAVAGKEEGVRVALRKGAGRGVVPLGNGSESALGARENRALIIGGGVVAGLAAVTGAALSIVSATALNDKDKAAAAACLPNKGSPNCVQIPIDDKERYNSSERLRATTGTAAIWAFAGAAVVGAATLTYALVKPGRQKKLGANSAGPTATQLLFNGASVAVAGTW